MLVSAVLLTVPAEAGAQPACPEPRLVVDNTVDAAIRANRDGLWKEANRILRLGRADQAREIGHVYRDIYSALHPHMHALANWNVQPPDKIDGLKSLSGRSFPGPYQDMYAQKIALALLAAHPTEAQPLIQGDLRSNDPVAIGRGISAAGYMKESRFPGLYEDLRKIFLDARECSDLALNRLFTYADFAGASPAQRRSARIYELTPVIIANFQRDPREYAHYLGELSSVGPVPDELLADLESEEPTMREMASLAVAGSTDPRLAVYVRRMLGDANPHVRLTAFNMGLYGLKRRDTAYLDIKPALDGLLQDPDWTVRLSVLESFAFAGDPVCIPVLLDLLQQWARGNAPFPEKDFGQLVILVESITHQRFGFDRTGLAREEPANRRAIEKFSEWVKARKSI